MHRSTFLAIIAALVFDESAGSHNTTETSRTSNPYVPLGQQRAYRGSDFFDPWDYEGPQGAYGPYYSNYGQSYPEELYPYTRQRFSSGYSAYRPAGYQEYGNGGYGGYRGYGRYDYGANSYGYGYGANADHGPYGYSNVYQGYGYGF